MQPCRPVLWTARCVLCLIVGTATAGYAITRREDIADSRYRALGRDPRFACIGLLNEGYCATLIAPRWAITAAHIAETRPKTLFLRGRLYTVVRSVIAPGWTRDDFAGNDLALLQLDRDVAGVAPVALYAETDEFGQVGTALGAGNSGDGRTGGTEKTDRTMRGMQNAIDASGADYGFNARILLSDFDSPQGATNALARRGSSAQPLALEGMVGVGDSGGGLFIEKNGRLYLAGVNVSCARWTGRKFDPDAGDGRYGDTLFSTRISSYAAWIHQVTAPESPTLLIVSLGGLGVLQHLLRRRKP